MCKIMNMILVILLRVLRLETIRVRQGTVSAVYNLGGERMTEGSLWGSKERLALPGWVSIYQVYRYMEWKRAAGNFLFLISSYWYHTAKQLHLLVLQIRNWEVERIKLGRGEPPFSVCSLARGRGGAN